MTDSSFYSELELLEIGLGSIGKDVRISRSSVLINPSKIAIGDYSRIDGFTLISGGAGVNIGSYVHIASFCSVVGTGGVKLGDFSGLSHGVRIFSASDDYSGDFLTNPTVPSQYTNVQIGYVEVGDHVIIGANSVVLPGLKIGLASAVGALTLVTKNLEPHGIYSGVPARFIKQRNDKLSQHANRLLEEK